MKKTIQCAQCKEVLGSWVKADFSQVDSDRIAESTRCTLGHDKVVLVDEDYAMPDWVEENNLAKG